MEVLFLKLFFSYFKWFVLALILILGGYLAYLFFDYDRLDDNLELSPTTPATDVQAPHPSNYTITTFNIGYAAYPTDYSFFMDDGKYSRAFSKEDVQKNLAGIEKHLMQLDSDVILLQEVDTKAHRSYKINQVEQLTDKFDNYSAVFGQNYDSSYLFYPFTKPIGKSQSGILTLSKYPIEQATRYSLPIETNFDKFFDLDRSFTVSQTTFDGQPVSLINIHSSAFTKDKNILESQIKKLAEKMASERSAGRSVIVGGDFNHDLLGNSPEVFDTERKIETWTHPFPEELLPEGFSVVKGDLARDQVPTVRASNKPYVKGENFVSLIDGFIVSDDIIVESVKVSDLNFANSDHNPVTLTFHFNKGDNQ